MLINMGNMTTLVILVVLLNGFLLIAQLSALTINPTGGICYHAEGTILEGANSTAVKPSDALGSLPGSSSSVSTGSSGFGTDLFTSILSFFKTSTKYVTTVVTAPYNVLKCVMPIGSEAIITIISFMWYVFSFFIVISYIWWRD